MAVNGQDLNQPDTQGADFRKQVFEVDPNEIFENAKFALERWERGEGDADDIISLNALITLEASLDKAAKRLGIASGKLKTAVARVA